VGYGDATSHSEAVISRVACGPTRGNGGNMLASAILHAIYLPTYAGGRL
jgi:hypothetical protein